MPPRVVIAVPLAGPMIYWRTVAGLLELERPGPSDLMVFQGALVDRARNILIEQALEHPLNPTHLLFVDADIILQPDTLSRLLAARKPVVSALYRKRLPPHEPLAYTEGKNGIFKPVPTAKKALLRVDYTGAGCLLIERKVLEKTPAPWFTSEWTHEGHLSEDFSFCRKVRTAGFELWVDTATSVIHLEPMGIGTGKDGSVTYWPS